jgi:cell wall-associated NlpC family hydrolase
LSRIVAILAVFSLFLVALAASAVAADLPVGGAQPVAAVSTGDAPGAATSPQLLRARASTLTAYRGALRAARRAGISLHAGTGLIGRSSSIRQLHRMRLTLLRREHRFQRVVRVIRAALGQRGSRYVWGGASPSGFDCSGLVMWSYHRAGIRLPHSTSALIGIGRRVARTAMLPGDLVFSDGGGHVGIYIGHGTVVHAPHAGTVVSLAALRSWSVVAIRRII